MSLPLADIGRRDGARLLALAFPPGERLRVDRRTRTQQRVVRRLDARRQNERVEVDVGGRAHVFRLDPVEGQGARVELLPIGRPCDGGVVRGIFRPADDQDEPPAQRLPAYPGDQAVEEVVLVSGRGARLVRLERLQRRQDPANRRGASGRIDEPEGVEAVEGGVVESGRNGLGLENALDPRRLRVAVDEGLQSGRIRLAGGWIGLRGDELLVERLGRGDGKHRQADHRGAPQLPVGKAELQSQAPYDAGGVGGVGLAARQGKPAQYWHPPRLEDHSLRDTLPIAVALEDARDPDTLGVVPARSRVHAVDLLESVGEPARREVSRREPSAEIREPARDDGEDSADHGESRERTGDAGRPTPGRDRGAGVDRHVILPRSYPNSVTARTALVKCRTEAETTGSGARDVGIAPRSSKGVETSHRRSIPSAVVNKVRSSRITSRIKRS